MPGEMMAVDSSEMMVVDCRKTRAAAEEWKRKPENSHWKKLEIPANQRLRLTGIEKGVQVDFARVRRSAVKVFAHKCGYTVEHFEAEKPAAEKWMSERKQRNSAIPMNQQHARQHGKGAAHVTEHVTSLELPSPLADNQSAPQPAVLQNSLSALHRRLAGYYELYHHATSKRRKRAISISLLHVNGIDQTRGALQCEIHDSSFDRPYFRQRGHITPIGGFLYWELWPDQQDAICYCCSYIPAGENFPGFTLYGIFLTTSGDGTREYPVAAKGALRFLGEKPNEALQNSLVDLSEAEGDPEQLLRARIGGYLGDLEKARQLRPQVLKEVTAKIVPMIDNAVSESAAPYALRMPR